MELIKPNALKVGSTLGIFTPSSPGYVWNEGLFTNGLKNLKDMGFKIKLGSLTEKRRSQGYRSGSAQERAQEFMNLINDPEVDGLISTIGGTNSSSLIPYLDFTRIRKEKKMICGFSDVTSLHLAILKFSGLQTVYGPSVMCWFGDWPNGVTQSTEWFLQASMTHKTGTRDIKAPAFFSNHQRRWDNDDWKNLERKWDANSGWKVLNPGLASGQILALNLNTLVSAAGTPYWPDFKNKLLLIEDMEAPFSRTERALRQLSFIGVFDEISGLIIGKPEVLKSENAPFTYDELFLEIVGQRNYPIVSNFDCSHCVPMISINQLAKVELSAHVNHDTRFSFLEGGIN